MLFDVATPMLMMAPMSAGTESVRAGREEHPHDPRERARERHQDDERVEPRLEVHDHERGRRARSPRRSRTRARGSSRSCSRPGRARRCVVPRGSVFRRSATIPSTASDTEPRSVPCTLACTSKVEQHVVVGDVHRRRVARRSVARLPSICGCAELGQMHRRLVQRLDASRPCTAASGRRRGTARPSSDRARSWARPGRSSSARRARRWRRRAA